jgi:hypothetical protein
MPLAALGELDLRTPTRSLPVGDYAMMLSKKAGTEQSSRRRRRKNYGRFRETPNAFSCSLCNLKGLSSGSLRIHEIAQQAAPRIARNPPQPRGRIPRAFPKLSRV